MGGIDPCGPGPVVPNWTSTGAILVLYILLVIILRSPFFI
ncbi:YjcZ family sporulation protein [Paenibacillus antibioticophila]|nr:YjcZ family sporulation protein [Paenibacillus antibioticophila]